MIERLLICNKGGAVLYSRDFGNVPEIESDLLGGLISVIDNMGHNLFKKKIATINFGEESPSVMGEAMAKIVFITKDMLSEGLNFYFIFFCRGEHSLQLLRQISTSIFIECKNTLRVPNPDLYQLETQVTKILQKFPTEFKGVA